MQYKDDTTCSLRVKNASSASCIYKSKHSIVKFFHPTDTMQNAVRLIWQNMPSWPKYLDSI